MTKVSDSNKRIAKNTILLYSRMLLTMLVSLYTSRVVLSTLGIENFGIYNVVGGVVTMFTFINTAMASATQRFLTFELGNKNKVQLHKVFCTSITIHLIISLAILILAETVGLWFFNTYLNIPIDRIYAAKWVYQLSILSTLVMIMSVPYNALIIAHERMSAFAYISIFEVSLKLIIVYMLTLFKTDKLILYAILLLGIQLFIRLMYGRYCVKNFEECHYKFSVNDKNLFKEMTSFAGWSLFGNLAAIAFTQGVNLLLNVFFGPIVNAARAVAVQIQSSVYNFVVNFQMALNPQITKNYACGNLEEMHKLIIGSSKYSYYLLFLLTLPIFLETEQILLIWLKNVPDYTVSFTRLILCIMLVDALANPLVTAAQATGKIKIYQIVVGGILLLIIPISYVTLKLGGHPKSVFIVHLIMVIASHIARLVLIRPLIHLSLLKYFKEVIIKVIFISVISLFTPLIINYYLPKDYIYSFILVCLSCIVSTIVCVYHWGLGNSERSFIQQKIKSILKIEKKNDKNS